MAATDSKGGCQMPSTPALTPAHLLAGLLAPVPNLLRADDALPSVRGQVRQATPELIDATQRSTALRYHVAMNGRQVLS